MTRSSQASTRCPTCCGCFTTRRRLSAQSAAALCAVVFAEYRGRLSDHGIGRLHEVSERAMVLDDKLIRDRAVAAG